MKNREIVIVMALGLGSLILRLLLISKGPFSHESLNLVLKAEETLNTHQLQYIFGTGYPIMVLMTALFIWAGKLFSIHDPVICANLMSVVCSSLTVVVFYLFLKKVFEATAALLGAVMLSVCPIFLGVSVYGYGHSFELIFLFGGLLFILHFHRTRRMSAIVLSGVFLGFLGATRIQDLVLVMPAVYFLLFFKIAAEDSVAGSEPLQNKFIQFIVLSAAAGFVTVLFHMPYLIGPIRQAYIDQYLVFKNASFSSEHQQSLLISFPFYKKWFIQNFSVIGLVAFCFGMLAMSVTYGRTAIFCLLWLSIPLLFFLTTDTTIPRFFVILLPSIIMVISWFFSLYLRKQSLPSRLLGAGCFMMILCLSFMEIYPVLKFRHDHALLPEYVRWVEQKIPSNAYLILMEDHFFFKHYGRFNMLARPMLSGEESQRQLADFKSRVDQMLDAAIPVYTTGVGLYSYDPNHEYANFVKKNYDLEQIGSYWYEDYHGGELGNAVFKNPLYRIISNKGSP